MSITGLIAIVLTISIVGLVALLAFLGQTDTDTFKILVGGLMTVGFTNIVGYYFGSSASSKGKDETILTMAGTASTAGALLGDGKNGKVVIEKSTEGRD